MRIARCVPLFATAFAVALAGFGPLAPNTARAQDAAPVALGGGPAAVVNDEIITDYDLRQRAMLIIISSGVRPTPENENQILQQALRSLIDEHLQLQELRRMESQQKFSIVAKDDEVEQTIAGLARDNGLSAEAFKARLASGGMDISTLKDQMRAQISWQRMIQGRYGARLKIGDEQVNQALARAKTNASRPQYLLSEIFIDSARAGGMDQAMEGARQLQGQMQQGAPFPAVARQFSGSVTAANGGDMGWVGAADLAPEVAAVVDQVQPRSVSAPIPARDGVYLIAVRDKRSGGSASLVSLKQAAVPLDPAASEGDAAAAQAKIAQVAAMSLTCDNVESESAKVEGIVSGDLGESDVSSLAPEFQNAIANLAVGQASAPVRTNVGIHVLLVCGRRDSNPQAPSRDAVQSRLVNDQLSMYSKRYLRDLRNAATIETP